ncbi:tRNA dimethylallyltransferase 2 [Vitis vinifera]|uniref:tRNA dimethylallyltransferase 2 n=1 Tax=Vitis vinifera TaxID=29760 RepID=A0A438F2W0_VITVI|nr:tRNA dimethylallyltransferase 2 [Vitis vinifera]
MEGDNGGQKVENPNPNPNKTKVVVIMGATGSGKSKLAIDLASHFPIEIINSDSMQVYQGLDVLTNKVPLHEQNGVPHHLLGTISSNVEFTSKDFRDSAIPLIDDIISRNNLPVLVGGTNYYIQALVSPFLLDDSAEEMDESSVHDHPGGNNRNYKLDSKRGGSCSGYDRLKDLDPVAANRIHPNDHRKRKDEVGEVESLLSKLHPLTIRRGVNDLLRWKENKNGTFSVKSFYNSLSRGIKPPFPTRTIWTPWVPIRTSFFGWEVAWCRLLTTDCLKRFGWSIPNRCFLCKYEEETIDHLLLFCEKARMLWLLIFYLFGVQWVMHSSVKRNLLRWHGSFGGKKREKAWRAAPFA